MPGEPERGSFKPDFALFKSGRGLFVLDIVLIELERSLFVLDFSSIKEERSLFEQERSRIELDFSSIELGILISLVFQEVTSKVARRSAGQLTGYVSPSALDGPRRKPAHQLFL